MVRQALLLVLTLPVTLVAQQPTITGISYVRFYTTDIPGTRHLYGDLLGLTRREEKGLDIYLVGRSQRIQLDPAAKPADQVGFEEEIGLESNNPSALAKQLEGKGLHFTKRGDAFVFDDRTGPRLALVKRTINPAHDTSREVSHRIIHAGFIAYDRAQEDALFRDKLGFKLYWSGNHEKTSDNPDWVSMQTPQGHEWIEYMLRQSQHPSQKSAGVMYHVSLGVPAIQPALDKMNSNGWSHPEAKPTDGLDGKQQYNLYDPDMTRVEMMTLAPTSKQCCSDFGMPNPTESDR